MDTDSIILSNLVAQRNGCLLHCNGIGYDGECFLLTGVSGAGKTTLSWILSHQGHEILMDDQMIVKKTVNGFTAHGLWCHGSQRIVSNCTYPLKGLFFLEQASVNTIKMMKKSRNLVPKVLETHIKSLLTSKEWQQTFDTLTSLIQEVPFYLVKFDLSGDIGKEFERILTLL